MHKLPLYKKMISTHVMNFLHNLFHLNSNMSIPVTSRKQFLRSQHSTEKKSFATSYFLSVPKIILFNYCLCQFPDGVIRLINHRNDFNTWNLSFSLYEKKKLTLCYIYWFGQSLVLIATTAAHDMWKFPISHNSVMNDFHVRFWSRILWVFENQFRKYTLDKWILGWRN